jgi:23S rRNA (uracil1939-C5)-methyltransferase
MIEHLRIVGLGHRGDGFADTPSGLVYVPYTLPGETVEVEGVAGHPDRRHMLRVLDPAADRILPICPHFGVCGGCAMQHRAEAGYRAWKRDLVVGALEQNRIEAPVGDLIDAHGEGRRRIVLHARQGGRGIVEVGFAGLRSHAVVPIDRCPVLAPSLDGAIEAAWAIAERLEPQRKPLDIQITATKGGLDIDVRGSGPLDAQQTARLAQLAESRRIARITRHGELVVRRAPPVIEMGRAEVTLPTGAFLQATERGEAVLAELVYRQLDKAKTVADLFAGVGPFALRIAERARVTAVDSDADALAALARAAGAPGLKPIETQRRDLFRRPLLAQELADFDAVVFDPPRQGAQTQARELANSRVPLVLAVSCSPATFARDARILIDGGYRLTSVTPVDQFRYAAHVEIVGVFRK